MKSLAMKYPGLACLSLRKPKLATQLFLKRELVISSMGEHIERTKVNYRQNIKSGATVIETKILSPTVIGVKLRVEDHSLTFFAGQWVDVFIPNVSQIGGFSMYSPPWLLEQSQQIQLAVKKSSWPPAQWVHSSCKVGDKIQIRIGGDFYYDPPSNVPIPDMIFIAGGVGINPLLSILLQLKHHFQIPNNEKHLPKNITLLYSAKQKEELLFQDTISELKNGPLKSFDYRFFVTRFPAPDDHQCDQRGSQLREGRVMEEDLRLAISKSYVENVICFICGPPPMADAIHSQLLKMGVTAKQIKYEKWW
ncbi:oxidoreductase NAD-binding domain-containing protein 1 [Daphnia magna]|uniref:oxidoreductase NAD-binding domain-containing protein 1 n=1 Tax=Daphnia magna TaxID=35525 RepID=UPI001E1BCEE6|nr:oxidoreductase NAD-binding domain-containing protein 1 [Daphnia magna]XP_045027422.1 oxidoreductase NAD-binding domain-containing protein 1 [Daphnia magna]